MDDTPTEERGPVEDVAEGTVAAVTTDEQSDSDTLDNILADDTEKVDNDKNEEGDTTEKKDGNKEDDDDDDDDEDDIPSVQIPIIPIKVPMRVEAEKEEQDAMAMRRESIRQRLRDREARLTSLVRSTSTDGADSILGQMRSVKENMEKIEKEKSELEEELQRLKNATGDDEFLTDKMNSIQEGFMKQVQTIQTLEDEIVSKNSEIDHLRNELVVKLRRIVELEFDLETHDVHYTDYATEQFKLGEEALAEIKIMEKEMGPEADTSDNNSDRSLGSAPGSKLTPRRAQKLISKLLSDLDNLEARYKDEKLHSVAQIERMKHDNEELQTKILVLEKQIADKKDGKTAASPERGELTPETIEATTEAFLRKRVETLEAKRSLYREENAKLQKELEELKKESRAELRRAEFDIDRLSLENEAMKSRVRALETDIVDSDPNLAQFALVQKKIRECYDEINKLEASNEIKDRQIATLKKDVTKLKMKEIASRASSADSGYKDYGNQSFSDFDAKIIRDDERRHHTGDSEGGSQSVDSTYLRDLQRQLQSAQQQLVKKDQELVIERAKAASTAAGLLARITELTSRHEAEARQQMRNSGSSHSHSHAHSHSQTTKDSKKKGEKKTPLRFYL